MTVTAQGRSANEARMRVIIEKDAGAAGQQIATMVEESLRVFGAEVVIVTPARPRRERDAALGIVEAA